MQRNSAVPPIWTLRTFGCTSTCIGVATDRRSSALASPPTLLATPESSPVTASMANMGPSKRMRGPLRTGRGPGPLWKYPNILYMPQENRCGYYEVFRTIYGFFSQTSLLLNASHEPIKTYSSVVVAVDYYKRVYRELLDDVVGFKSIQLVSEDTDAIYVYSCDLSVIVYEILCIGANVCGTQKSHS
ncbi:hypothetical protein FF38_06638 [Lucilia cuprina]|uniref:Uncharacterized protein n=1 Tax=Lucilia cuprina TaxID=7375 RepID=A0A0L0C5C7_LUCCU|nr:hypothetical protein FF38_06638 [Lucilia cuprina]